MVDDFIQDLMNTITQAEQTLHRAYKKAITTAQAEQVIKILWQSFQDRNAEKLFTKK